ncbi:MAG: hypothetical protein DRJ44_03940 [Thermoprotei archaeon]|nr:MAG: hypothetical protein DRJ44_03940 [Thermoprotei archaeon]
MVRMLVVFISKPQWEVGWPFLGFDNDRFKAKIMEKLQDRFKDVEFIDEGVITRYQAEKLNEIKEKAENSDGLIIFTIGHYGDPGIIDAGVELIQLYLPTILANLVYYGDHTFTKIFDRIKGEGYRVLPVSTSDFEDIAHAVDIMRRILFLKRKKIIVYTLDKEVKPDFQNIINLVSPAIEKLEMKDLIESHIKSIAESTGFYIDLAGIDQAHSWRRNEEAYQKNLKEIFGLRYEKRDPDEILRYYNDVSIDEAKEIAEKWMRNAENTRFFVKSIVNSARLYLAMKKLMEDTGADMIAIDCGTLMLAGKLPAWPCLANFQLWNEGLNSTPESDLDSGITLLLVKYLLDRPGYVSNQSIDLSRNRVTYLHCCSPSKLYGIDKPSLSYEIVGHGESRGLGPCPFVKYPKGEDITTVKISVLKRKISVRTGKIIDVVWDEKGCRNKVLVDTNARKILENYDWDTFGWHRVSVLGNWREEIFAAAKLLGLEVVEEDK